jgi:hypothetical protein
MRRPLVTGPRWADGVRWLLFGLLAVLLAQGRVRKAAVEFAAGNRPPTMTAIRPRVRNIGREVGPLRFIEAYDRPSISAEPADFIEESDADIGNRARKGDTLASLLVPDPVEDRETGGATIVLDRDRIAPAKDVVGVARPDHTAARAGLQQALAVLEKCEADVERWDLEIKQLQCEVAVERWDAEIKRLQREADPNAGVNDLDVGVGPPPGPTPDPAKGHRCQQPSRARAERPASRNRTSNGEP